MTSLTDSVPGAPPKNTVARMPKVYFIIPTESDEELQYLSRLDVDEHWRHFSAGSYAWCLQTYLLLKARGVHVGAARDYVSGAVNVVHATQILTMPPRPDAYVVSVQADYFRVPWADHNIVQNRTQQSPKSTNWMPHWPQPGLVPREPTRHGVRVIAFAGRPCWLASGAERWRRALSIHDLDFRVLGPSNWNDFSQIDVLIAIRSFDTKTYNKQPPSKIFNAWLASVPLIAGGDSAFRQVGHPGIDYIQVSSLHECLRAIVQLKDEPAYYRSIVDAGLRRATDFSRENIARQWEQLLFQSIVPAFSRSNVLGYRSVRWHVGTRAWLRYRNTRKGMKAAYRKLKALASTS